MQKVSVDKTELKLQTNVSRSTQQCDYYLKFQIYEQQLQDGIYNGIK